jgi:hypothetical protein
MVRAQFFKSAQEQMGHSILPFQHAADDEEAARNPVRREVGMKKGTTNLKMLVLVHVTSGVHDAVGALT